MTIERRENRLFAKPTLGQEIEIFPESETSFFTDEPGVEGKLVLDEQRRCERSGRALAGPGAAGEEDVVWLPRLG